MAEALPDFPDSDFSDDDLSPLDIQFNEAANHVRKLTNKLDNNQLLELYGLYKQSTEGKCNAPKPGWLDGKGRKKWEAWRALGDLPGDQAKEKYIELVHKHDPELSNNHEPGSGEAWVAVSTLRSSSEPDLNHQDLTILDAARENLGKELTQLLSLNPELKDYKDDDGLTALHWAADRGATEALTAAIEAGCNVDAVDESGQTPLHYAASCGHVESTRILVAAGASVIKDEDGSTPFDLATDDEIRKILEAKF